MCGDCIPIPRELLDADVLLSAVVPAEGELVEVGLEVFAAEAVADAQAPTLEV